MSVLIKGMEMPKSCEKCPFLDYEEGFCFARGVKGNSGWYEFTFCPSGIKDGRADNCPLVEIPPHGRLIDADCCNGYFYEHMSDDMMIVAMNAINEMPTIIEAEEGE